MSIRNMMIGGAGATAPGAPTSVVATATGATTMSVAFSAPAENGGSAITSFTVTSNPGGVTASGGSSPITVTGLTASTSYTFTVTATNAIGTGPASSASSAVSTQSADLYSFSTTTFRTGDYNGRDGPDEASARGTVTGTGVDAWKSNGSYYSVVNGIQYWTVPATGTYRITARGATGASGSGGSGGAGAKIQVDVNLTISEIIRILVGQPGTRTAEHGGGGGGTFVVRSPYDSDGSILVIAGGGGGRRQDSAGAGINGNYGQLGGDIRPGIRSAGGNNDTLSSPALNNTAGSGFTPTSVSIGQGGGFGDGSFGDGGGGFYGNGGDDGGQSPVGSGGGRAFINGGQGGGGAAPGGFGGGGSGQGGNGGGGAGGYTGGNGGFTAGGGGSFTNSSATNIVLSTDGNTGPAGTALTGNTYQGFVIIQKL